MTPGERDVWIAVYAANWTRLRSEKRAWDTSDATLALEAADEAGGAVEALREVRKSPDFGADAREVIGPHWDLKDWREGDIVTHRDGRTARLRNIDLNATGTAYLSVFVPDEGGITRSEWWTDEDIIVYRKGP